MVAVLGLVVPGDLWRAYRYTGTSACAVAVVSLLCTVVHRGPVTAPAEIWVLVEAFGLSALVFTAVRYAAARGAIGAAALGVLALGIQPLRMLWWASPAATWTEYVFFLGGWTLIGLAAVAIGLSRRFADCRKSRTLAAVRRRERLALVGDLHDLVAHDVTGIVLEAQATRVEADAAQVPEALNRIEEAGLQAMAAMDRTVTMLRGGGDSDPDSAAPGTRPYGAADLLELIDRFAATGRIPVRRAGSSPSGPTPLTSRETELTRLVARGCSNADIAAELFISVGTVKTHVANIQAKPGVANRVGIAAWTWETGRATP
ncbi:helix-turn-helix transcriptional regulator [Streptomyces sp. Wh19]|uniref:helix-turn-helix transcriptional regulator n=1 Tax=Streptomyces sp. Wh19 TaxID=3076629 RepID=UPI00295849C2|nr:LuxR C-terminal-related transcriptional regulator [Streptomyces sp. Wh19]MDV9197459.1 LuxR C-terminal-related transcriptional regulator [Streptomyces sp. Wh19]